MNTWSARPIPFKDKRGDFVRIWSVDVGSKDFVEDDITVNHKGVIRGIHGDGETWKTITCLYGKAYLVIVDPKSKEWVDREMVPYQQEIIASAYGVGYQALSEPTILHYKQSTKYGTYPQYTLPWDGYGIPWPVKKPILSERDKNAKEVRR